MKSYPFTSEVTYDEMGLPLYDRAVDSAFLRAVFERYFSDGVFYNPASSLQVVAGTGMQVKVQPGACHIRGAMGILDEAQTITLAAAGTQPRITTIVARLDLSRSVRSVDIYARDGEPAVSPERVILTRDATVWELGLADILVGANVQTIQQAAITDTRLDSDRCGIVAAPMATLDTSTYYSQMSDAMDTLREGIKGVQSGTEWMMRTTYDPRGKQTDIFADVVYKYKAFFALDGWEETEAGSGVYIQTAPVFAIDGGPTVTASFQEFSPLLAAQTENKETNEIIMEALGVLNSGYCELLDGAMRSKVFELPETDVEVILALKQGTEA